MAKSGDKLERRDAGGTRISIELRDLIASSGEGEIWRTSAAGEIAKIYISDQGLARRGEKLAAMLAFPPKDPAAPDRVSIAWPSGLLKDTKGVVLGFTMPEVQDAKRPPVLYNQALRKRTAPGVDWFYIHTAAQNIAKVCSAVHDRGYVIGDLKAENFLVDRYMQTVVIDTDSFQIRDPKTNRLYHCPVGTPEYTPRELMNKDFGSLERLPEHDHFAMAVLIYQFLMAQHPFSGGQYRGRGEAPHETVQRIEQGLWLYGRHGQYTPVRNDPPFNTLHPALQSLFKRCFDDGHTKPGARPSAKEWEVALEQATSALAWCTTDEMHVYSGHHKGCSWCAMRKATGHDSWPTYKKGSSRSFEFAKQRLRIAHRNGDMLVVLTAIDNNPRLKGEKDLKQVIAEAEKFRPVKGAFEAAQNELAKPEPNFVLIADMANKEPRLKDLATGQLAQNLQEMLDLASAVQKLEAAVTASPARQGKFALAGERAIELAFAPHQDAVKKRSDLTARFRTRVAEARQRIARFDRLSSALTANDENTVSQELEEYRPVLQSVVEYSALSADAERIAARVKLVRAFIARASDKSTSDEELCSLWESDADVARAKLAITPSAELGGETPANRYAASRIRRDDIAKLSALMRDLDAKAGPEFVADHESRLLAAYTATEQRVGSLGTVQGGALSQRARAAEHRTAVFALAGKLATKPRTEDYEVARNWRQVADRNRYRIDGALRARFAEAEAIATKVDTLANITSRAPIDEVAIVAFGDANTDVLTSPAAAGVDLDGLTPDARVALARQRVAADREFIEVVRRVDATREKTDPGERAIHDHWQRLHSLIEPWPAARDRHALRARLAYERLSRAHQLAQAHANGDQATLLQLWGEDGVLDDYTPAQPFRAAVVDAQAIADKLQQLKDRLRNSRHDDVGVLAIALSAQGFMSTPYATSPLPELGGQSIAALVAFAERRARFLEDLQATVQDKSGRRLLALAAAWDPALDPAHPRIKPYLALIQSAGELQQRLNRLKQALQSGDQAALVATWDNASFAGLDELAADAARIRTALKTYVERAQPFAKRPLGGVTRRSEDRMVIAWHWNDERVTHAYVLIGDRRPPNDHADAIASHLVERRETLQRDGVEVQFNGGMLCATVRPVLLFNGERLEGENGIVIQEGKKRVIEYRVQGSLLGLGSRVLKLTADRSMTLPELELVAGENERVLDWGETQTDKSGKLEIDLGGALRLKRRTVMLKLKNPHDADWIEIRHPPEGERRASA